MESRCSHPDCTVELGITETDLGPLCGLHIQHAKDIMRGEEWLISAEVRIRELEAQLAAITADRNLYRDDRDEEGHPYSEVVALREQLAERDRTIELVRGAMAAQDERERDAAKRLGMIHNCDWPDNVADEMEARDRTIAALQERVRELEDALVEAIGTIRAWNGEATWDIYNTCSPEMKHINAALNPPAKERP